MFRGICFLLAILATVPCSADYGDTGAFTSVSGSVDVYGGEQKTQSGQYESTVLDGGAGGEFATGSWGASARVHNGDGVSLGAYANATGQELAEDGPGAGAGAYARWGDYLTFKSPEVIDPNFLLQLFAYVAPNVNGTLRHSDTAEFAPGSAAEFNVIAGSTQSSYVAFRTPGNYSQTLLLKIPANELINGAYFSMELWASAHVYNGASNADFNHTAYLPAILLADADGNYLPGSERLEIVGQSGLGYATVTPLTVPEPSNLAILGLIGVVSVAIRLRAR